MLPRLVYKYSILMWERTSAPGRSTLPAKAAEKGARAESVPAHHEGTN